MEPPTITEPVLPPLTNRPVEPSADLSIVIDPPLSRSTVLLLFRVTAAPEATATLPPLAMRMLSAAVPVALDVCIGVVRAFEITISAWDPVATIKGAIATAVASKIRIR